MAQQTPSFLSGISITRRILIPGLVIIAASIALLLFLTVRQFNHSVQQQADALGEALVVQTAHEISAPLAVADSLALAAVLRELVNNPYVAHAALYSVDNRTMAEAGRRPPATGSLNSLYTRSIAFEQVIAGQLHIHIDVKRLQKPLSGNLQQLALLGIGILLLAVFVLSRIARSITQPLNELQHWLARPLGEAPYQYGNDETGQLARTLNQYVQLSCSLPGGDTGTDDAEARPADTEDPAAVAVALEDEQAQDVAEEAPAEVLPEHCAVLAVELDLGQAEQMLDEERHARLLDHYEQALEEVAFLYQGRLLELADHKVLLLFHSDQDSYVEDALHAAELLRAFAHALQIEIADSGIALCMQLGISHGDAILDLSEPALMGHPAVRQAIELNQHSRNLVLISQSLAEHPATLDSASIHNLTRPADSSCIVQLLSPGPEQLDEQLQELLQLQDLE